LGRAIGEGVHGSEDGLVGVLGRRRWLVQEDRLQALHTELLVLGVHGLGDAVGVQQERVAGILADWEQSSMLDG